MEGHYWMSLVNEDELGKRFIHGYAIRVGTGERDLQVRL